MSRLRADFLLLITAVIWGFAFVAQKTGMDGALGPLGFAGVRFILSIFVILPIVMRETRLQPELTLRDIPAGLLLCFVFVGGVLCQQIGLMSTTVTNAGFYTSLYVLGTPFVAWLMFRSRPGWVVWPACLLAVAGSWLLNGAALSGFTAGDWIVLAGAAFWSVQVVLLGVLVQRTQRPLALSLIQYGATVAVCLPAALLFEGITIAALRESALEIFYAGAISGGIAYTLQAVAQRHTPPSDAAIIMAGEAVFAAVGGMLILGERLDPMGWAGCGLILAAIVMVEAGVLFLNRKKTG